MTPLYGVELIDGQFKCKLILPINSPLRKTIEGPIKATIEEAQFSTALEACHQLRQIHELDDTFQDFFVHSSEMDKRVWMSIL